MTPEYSSYALPIVNGLTNAMVSLSGCVIGIDIDIQWCVHDVRNAILKHNTFP